MIYTTAVHSVMPLVLGLVALSFVGLGLFGISRRRPFVLSARWLLALFVLCFSPSLVMQGAVFADMGDRPYSGSLRAASLIAPLMLVVVIVFMAIATKGYLVFSATQSSLRDGLLAALGRLGLPFEETLATLRLPTVPAELHVAVQGWIGTGQVRLRGGKGGALLRDLAKAMNDQFRLAPAATNRTWAVAYLTVGVLMGAMVAVM